MLKPPSINRLALASTALLALFGLAAPSAQAEDAPQPKPAQSAAASPAKPDDLAYLDARLPFSAASHEERLRKAVACTQEGDGRCYLYVVAEILRSFRAEVGPLAILSEANMGYFVHAAGQWEGSIRRRTGAQGRDRLYGPLSSAVYYGHKQCWVDDLWGAPGALAHLDSIDVETCPDARCRDDVSYFVENVQDYLRENCL